MYLSQIDEQISINFLGFNDAPPTNAPFTSGRFKIDGAFSLFTLPPYKILIVFCFVPNILLRMARIKPCTLCCDTLMSTAFGHHRHLFGLLVTQFSLGMRLECHCMQLYLKLHSETSCLIDY